jgi:hypothetical protein
MEDDMSRQISALRQRVLDACKRADFYRRERDFFKSLADQQPGAEARQSRPPSPPSPPKRLSSVTPSQTSLSTDYDDLDRFSEDWEEDSHQGPTIPMAVEEVTK